MNAHRRKVSHSSHKKEDDRVSKRTKKPQLEAEEVEDHREESAEEDSTSSEEEEEDENGQLLDDDREIEIIGVIQKIRKQDPSVYDETVKFFDASQEEKEKHKPSQDDGQSKKPHNAKKSKKKMTTRDYLTRLADSGREEDEDFDRDDDDDDDDDDDPSDDCRVGGTSEDHGSFYHVQSSIRESLEYDQEQRDLRKALLSKVEMSDDDDNDDSDHDAEKGVTKEGVKSLGKEDEEGIDEDEMEGLFKMKGSSVEFPTRKQDGQGTTFLDYVQKKSKEDKTAANALGFFKEEDISEEDRFLRDYVMGKKWTFQDGESTGDHEISVEEDEKELDRQDNFEAKYNFRFEEQGDQVGIISYPREIGDSLRVDPRKEKRKERRDRKKKRKELDLVRKEEEIKRLRHEKREQIAHVIERIQTSSGGRGILKDFSIDGEFDEEKHTQLMELLGQDESDGPKSRDTEELANLLDDYFQLHYEDVVSGIPTRFKYTETTPENFGLTALDILEMDDSELDKIMPLKHIVPYGEQMVRRRWTKPKEDKKKEYRKLKRKAKRKQIPTEVLREYKKPKKSE